MNSRRIAFVGVMSAACAALGYTSIVIGNFKISFESIPVIAAAMTLGPLCGAFTGAVGTFIYQTIRYGLTPTTVLWMLPYVAGGIVCGLYCRFHRYECSRRGIYFIVSLSEFVMFILNTVAIYADSRLFGYYFPGIIISMLPARLAVCAILSILTGVIMERVVPRLKKMQG